MFTGNMTYLLLISAVIIFGIPLIGGAIFLKTNKKIFIYSAMILDFFCFLGLLTWILMK